MECPICGRTKGRNGKHRPFTTARQIIQHVKHSHPDYAVEGDFLDVWVRSPDGHTHILPVAHKEVLIADCDFRFMDKPEFPVRYDAQGREHEVF